MAWWGEGSVRQIAVVCMALCCPLSSILITHNIFSFNFLSWSEETKEGKHTVLQKQLTK